MESQAKAVQFEEFITNAPSIFSQIEKGGKGVLVEHEGELFSLKKVSKLNRSKKGIKTRNRAITPDDSILGIIGIGRSHGSTDTSENHHEYLADAYSDLYNA